MVQIDETLLYSRVPLNKILVTRLHPYEGKQEMRKEEKEGLLSK